MIILTAWPPPRVDDEERNTLRANILHVLIRHTTRPQAHAGFQLLFDEARVPDTAE